MATVPSLPPTPTLSDQARLALQDIAYSPAPKQVFNPGVVNRLLRDGFIEEVQLPSPYPTHEGKRIAFARITDKGREATVSASQKTAPGKNHGSPRI